RSNDQQVQGIEQTIGWPANRGVKQAYLQKPIAKHQGTDHLQLRHGIDRQDMLPFMQCQHTQRPYRHTDVGQEIDCCKASRVLSPSIPPQQNQNHGIWNKYIVHSTSTRSDGTPYVSKLGGRRWLAILSFRPDFPASVSGFTLEQVPVD